MAALGTPNQGIATSLQSPHIYRGGMSLRRELGKNKMRRSKTNAKSLQGETSGSFAKMIKISNVFTLANFY
jgi:hypothetical protein